MCTILSPASFNDANHQSETEGFLDVSWTLTTESGVDLRWIHNERATPNLDDLAFTYRLVNPIDKPKALEWRKDVGRYRATTGHKLFDWGRFNRLTFDEILHPEDKVTNPRASIFLTNASENGEIEIAVRSLKFPETEYLFELMRTRPIDRVSTTGPPEDAPTHTHTEVMIADIRVRTGPRKKPPPPQVGNGVFQLNDVNATHRCVRIYWREAQGRTRVSVWKRTGVQETIVASDIDIDLADGFLTDYVDADSYSYAFTSARLGADGVTKSVIIPARDNYVQGPVRMTRKLTVEYTRTLHNHTYALKWRKPEGVTAHDYTVAWVTGKNKIVDRVYDFVHVKHWTRYIEVDMEVHPSDFQLAVGVNTANSSSGLYLYSP
jgi:hypothetical protein